MKIRFIASLLLVGIAFMFTFTTPVAAAKKRVWGKKIITSSSSSGPFSVTAKFSGWKQYLNLNFRGLSSTKGVSYEFVYTSNGIDQGAGGMVGADAGNVTKQLFLGTCSYRVCTAHKNISNVRLRISYTTTSGQSVTKNYKVKY